MSESDYTDEEGELLVRTARRAVEAYVKEGRRIQPSEDLPKKFWEKRGVFVTLNRTLGKEKELRGCIGLPYPEFPLAKALLEAALSSAANDPRFEPVSKEELSDLLVEVSVLTLPEEIRVNSPREYPSRIRIGRDGLIVKWSFGSGLLLPQVPVEYGWDVEEYLSHACMKAGGAPDLWLLEGTKIYRFSAEVFEEETPNGRVLRKALQ